MVLRRRQNCVAQLTILARFVKKNGGPCLKTKARGLRRKVTLVLLEGNLNTKSVFGFSLSSSSTGLQQRCAKTFDPPVPGETFAGLSRVFQRVLR